MMKLWRVRRYFNQLLSAKTLLCRRAYPTNTYREPRNDKKQNENPYVSETVLESSIDLLIRRLFQHDTSAKEKAADKNGVKQGGEKKAVRGDQLEGTESKQVEREHRKLAVTAFCLLNVRNRWLPKRERYEA